MECNYRKKQKSIEDISIVNSLNYNNDLKNRIGGFTGHDVFTNEMMKVVLEELILSMNKSALANKKLFYIKCLELLN